MIDRLKRMFRVRKASEDDDADEHEHEHTWHAIGVYELDTSLTPTVLIGCSCGAWSTHEMNADYRVETEAPTWRM